MARWFQEWMAQPTWLMGIISGLVALSVFLVVLGLARRRAHARLQRRLEATVGRVSPGELDVDTRLSFRERVLAPLLRALLVRLGRFTPAGNLEHLRRQLIMAGNPGNLAVIDFLGLKMLTGIATGVLGILYLATARSMPLGSAAPLGVGIGLVGTFLPNYWLSQRIRQRQAAIARALPDALDMLTTMVDAGLGFDMALIRLCEKWNNPLTEEFERVVLEMRMGVRRSEALRHLAERTGVPELNVLVAVLIQADRLGMSIANILHTQSAQMRTRRRQWVEEKAGTMPLKMLPIIVVFIFPALFAILLGPAVPGLLAAFGGR